MDRKQIAATLEEFGTLLDLQGANPFKVRAFHNAARAVGGITRDLPTLIDSGELLSIPGIGKSIGAIIAELVSTGRSKEHDELKKAFPPGIFDLLRIQGLGPKKVRLLHDRLKISDLDGLERAAAEGRLASLDGFGAKSQENVLKGIRELRSRSDRVLYPVAREAATEIFEGLMARREVIRGEVAGSLRRHKEVIGDIDLLVSAKEKDRAGLMKAFAERPEVESVVAKGETKSTVRLHSGIHCDLRIVSDEEFPYALAYFTGSKEHNVAMRARANERGWSLNEYGFTVVKGKKKPPVCHGEAEIYEALGCAYVPPELREETGEIAAAEKRALPHLVEVDDIRGTFHCHTTYSDGVHTLEQMAEAAKELGWEYLGIADHSRSARYAGGLTEARVKEQRREIDALNRKLGSFRLFAGTECDILPDGSLDWPGKVMAGFDYVVVSVHSQFNMSEAAMTKRIIKALKQKHVTMLGHPTGRLLLSREPYPVDMIQVINAAADFGVMIEINAHPMRFDLDWRLCRYAREKGVLLPVNPDAHTVDGLHDVEYGVGIARKGWVTAEGVLNTRPASEVEKILSGKRA
jgi:DNA polymerase (family 10)